MRRNAATILGIFLFIGIFFSGSVLAGQVVTQELSQWASQAIANERTLQGVLPTRSVAVLYFQNLTGDVSLSPLQKGLSVMLTTDLAKVKDLQVVERARLQAILEEIELGTTGLVDGETAARVGQLVGARFLSGGDILKGSVAQLRIDPNLLNVSDQIMVNQAAAEGNLNDLIAIEKEILFEIIHTMDIVLTPDQKAELEKPISTSIPALMLLFKGIDASDHGQYAKAADLYEQALVKDPNLTPAKDALSEINALDLASQSAKTAPGKEAAPEIASAPKKSGGLLKYAVVGLGVAAAGAGGYYLATADDDDDDEDDEEEVLPPADTIRPTVTRTNPRPGNMISCSGGNIEFHFSEAMYPSVGAASADDSGWVISSTEWTDGNQTLVLYWDNSESNSACDSYSHGSSVTFTLSGYTDIAGNALDGETRFTYIREVY